jgi:CheY-like chemotaxis protein
MAKKVIVVDDSLVSILVTKTVLSKNGFEVVQTFQNGEDFIAYFKRNSGVDAVIMDLVLPGMTGFEAIKRAKAINQGVKIFVLSSLGDSPQPIQSAIEAGASNVIIKPFEAKAFIELLNAELT